MPFEMNMDVQPQPDRARKRRRRTMACTQCRSRKLKCDREYPTCSRCSKSRTPSKCTYEDGFLWQQPTTVATTAFAADRDSTVPVPQADRTPVQTPPEPAMSTVSARLEPFPTSEPTPSHPTHHIHHGLSGHALTPSFRSQPPRKERRDCFLETVLGAPKAGVRQDPYVNTSLLNRQKLPPPEHSVPSSRVDDDDAYRDEEHSLSPSHQLDLSPRIMMRGREAKTRFNGSGIFANLIAQFPDIKPFAEEIKLSNPIISQIRPDLERVKRGLWKLMPLNTPFPEPTTASLVGMLPSRGVVDELIGLYLTYIESTHRIIHVPSFLREVEKFWAMRESPGSISAGFAVLLLLVLACAWNLADFTTLQSKSVTELKCYTAVEWVLHAERWIENLHNKRPEITSMRLSILLILAQNSHGMKCSQAWLASSTLVKQAMMAGYHRDPSQYTRISIFNKEMRRRIWYTIVELDVQIALDRGMPPSVQSFDFDATPPLNIHDDEINESTTEAPDSRPCGEITDTSFQCILARSLPLRLQACSLMHSPRITCRYEDIQRLDWELNKHLARIPSWATTESHAIVTQHKVILWKALIESTLAQSLLSVHTPFAIEARREALFAPSARSRLDAATRILSNQQRMHDTSRYLSLRTLGEWTIHAYLSICQLLHPAESDNATPFTSASSAFIQNLPGLPESLISLVETSLVSLEQRSLLITKGAKDYFFLSTIVALVKARLWPAQATLYRQQVTERILSFAQTLFSRHIGCEHLGPQGMGNFKNSQQSIFTMAPPMMPIIPTEYNTSGIPPPPPLGVTPPGEFDPFLEIFDWDNLTGMALPCGD